jgi:hypothetical protein
MAGTTALVRVGILAREPSNSPFMREDNDGIQQKTDTERRPQCKVECASGHLFHVQHPFTVGEGTGLKLINVGA